MLSQTSFTNTGFVDAHVHLREASGLACAASAGIGALRDAGFRRNIDRGIIKPGTGGAGPAVVTSGWALYSKGGYGSTFGIAVSTPEQIQEAIISLKRAGADIIKTMASGKVSFEHPGQVTAGGFSSEELAGLVCEAAAQGLGVMAHANGEPAIIAAAQAGVRSIEHGFFMTEQALGLMAEKAIFWVPTIGALERAAASYSGPGDAKKFAGSLIHSQLTMLRYAHSIGVPLAIGTDCVLPDPAYRAAYHAEIELFEQAGIPHDSVMHIASAGGAKLLKM